MESLIRLAACAGVLFQIAESSAQLALQFDPVNFTGNRQWNITRNGAQCSDNSSPNDEFPLAGRRGGGGTGGGLVDCTSPTICGADSLGCMSAAIDYSITQLSPTSDNISVSTSGYAQLYAQAVADGWRGSWGCGVSPLNGDPVQVQNTTAGPLSYLMIGSGKFAGVGGSVGVVPVSGLLQLTNAATRMSLSTFSTDADGQRLCDDNTGNLEIRVSAYTPCAQAPTWRSLPTRGPAPSPRVFASGVYDNVRARLIAFGGYTGGSPDLSDETWVWDGSAWTLLPVPLADRPPARFSPAIATSPDSIVMHGGWARNAGGAFSPLNDTWTIDLNAPQLKWTRRTPAQSPGGRYGHKMVYQAGNFRFVMFGGADTNFPPIPGQQLLNDTWTWNGFSWSRISAGGDGTIPRRKDHAMAYDAARGNIVLFGGAADNSGNSARSDLWVFANNAWTQRTPATIPPARDNHAMAYDPEQQTVVMHGGAGGGEQNTVWSWDGTNWSSRDTPGPAARRGQVLAFSPLHHGVIHFAGMDGLGVQSNGIWAYSGGGPAFTQELPARVPFISGSPIQLSAAVSGSEARLRWRRDGVALFDGIAPRQCGAPRRGSVAGAATASLVITNPTLADLGVYSLLASDDCGAAYTRSTTVLVGCPSDLDDGSDTGRPDGGVTIDDLLYFLRRFELGQLEADLDDGSGTWTPDGGVTIEDLLFFLQRFDAGC